MRYHFRVHREKRGYWAECIELPGCLTQADTKAELEENMQEALNTYLEEPEDSKYVAPSPKKGLKKASNIVGVLVDPAVALAYSIRKERLESGLTQNEVAKKLGLKGLYSYQRLEKRCNPSLDLICKILLIFPALSLDKILR